MSTDPPARSRLAWQTGASEAGGSVLIHVPKDIKMDHNTFAIEPWSHENFDINLKSDYIVVS